MADGHELPGGGGGGGGGGGWVRGNATPKMFRKEYALRCSLVYFKTQF